VAKAIVGADMVAPDLINVDVLSALRRLEQAGVLASSRAGQAIIDLRTAPLRRYPTLRLLDDVWRLRVNVSAYDATYVALAQAMRCPLVTTDARLARAPRLGISVIVA
jgi:predicted nucleic acid-binding protein